MAVSSIWRQGVEEEDSSEEESQAGTCCTEQQRCGLRVEGGSGGWL